MNKTIDTVRLLRLAQVGYEGYCAATGGRSAITGDELPAWQGLPARVQDAWAEAAAAIWRRVAVDGASSVLAAAMSVRGKKFRVRIRRGDGRVVRPEAEQLDGRVFTFNYGWPLERPDYPDEFAWYSLDPDYPADAPTWIASGDLEEP